MRPQSIPLTSLIELLCTTQHSPAHLFFPSPTRLGGKSLTDPSDPSFGLPCILPAALYPSVLLPAHLHNNRCLLGGQQCQACLSCHPGHLCPWHLTQGGLGTQEAARDLVQDKCFILCQVGCHALCNLPFHEKAETQRG